MHQKSIEKTKNKNIILSSNFSSKMEPKWPQNGREKSEKIWLWASWAAKVAPKDPQSHPRDPHSPQNKAQGTPRA
jgi:hypothetical protein